MSLEEGYVNASIQNHELRLNHIHEGLYTRVEAMEAVVVAMGALEARIAAIEERLAAAEQETATEGEEGAGEPEGEPPPAEIATGPPEPEAEVMPERSHILTRKVF